MQLRHESFRATTSKVRMTLEGGKRNDALSCQLNRREFFSHFGPTKVYGLQFHCAPSERIIAPSNKNAIDFAHPFSSVVRRIVRIGPERHQEIHFLYNDGMIIVKKS